MKKNHLLSPAYIMLILFSCAAIARQVYDIDHPNDPPPKELKVMQENTVHYTSSDNLRVTLNTASYALSTILGKDRDGATVTKGLGNCPGMEWYMTTIVDGKITTPVAFWGVRLKGILGLPAVLTGCDNNYYNNGNAATVVINLTPQSTIAIINSGYNHYQKVHSDAPEMMPYGLPFTKLYWKVDVEWWYPDITRTSRSKPGVYRCNVTVNNYYQLYNNVGDNPGNMGTVSGESGHSDRINLDQCTIND